MNSLSFMGRKKKTLDDFDFQQVRDEDDDLQGTPEVEKISLRDFIIPSKVQAFCQAYRPAKREKQTTYVFTDERLRQFFKAYVCGLGDPLKLYIEDLKMAGFVMTVDMATGEPCILADPR